MLAREVLRLRGTINRMTPWDVMVDLFFYRDPAEVEQQAKEEQAQREAPVEAALDVPPAADWDAAAPPVAGGAGDWGAPVAPTAPIASGEWGAMPSAPIATSWDAAESQWQ